MTQSLGVTPWMSATATRAVIAALEAGGYPGCARFVGGAVRNTLMGLEVGDIDIATVLTPDQVMAALAQANLKSVPTGLDHGTVTAIADHTPFEITTLRKDVDTDGRHAVVAFTSDWAEDAHRRDFRFNALYADPQGQVFDPTGEGVADAMAGRVVFVGDPATRLREDYLRILRFFRFYAWYGRGSADRAALEACQALRGMLMGRPAERVQKEVMRLLAAPDPRPSLTLMKETGVLAEVLPEVKSSTRLYHLVSADQTSGYGPDAELRLAALLPPGMAAAEEAARRLKLSNAARGRLIKAAAEGPHIHPGMGPKAVRQTVWRIGVQAFCDRARLVWAEQAAVGEAAPVDAWQALIAMAERWIRPTLPAGGEDAVAAGAPRGPQVGQALAALEAWWIDQDFPADRGMVLAELKAIVGNGAK